MGIQYYRKWVGFKKAPITPFTEPQARRRHETRQSYVAVVDESEKPLYVIHLAGDWVSVLFLDDLARIYLNYDFKEVEKGRLFLKTAIYRQYIAHSQDVASAITFQFEPDGRIWMEEVDRLQSITIKKETTASPTAHWEQYPDFGHYTALCKLQREPGALHVLHAPSAPTPR